jgi:hypothetical protein
MGVGNTYGHLWDLGTGTSGNVYFAGDVGKLEDSSSVPVYWKNGTLNFLPMGDGNAYGGTLSMAITPKESPNDLGGCVALGSPQKGRAPKKQRTGFTRAAIRSSPEFRVGELSGLAS